MLRRNHPDLQFVRKELDEELARYDTDSGSDNDPDESGKSVSIVASSEDVPVPKANSRPTNCQAT